MKLGAVHNPGQVNALYRVALPAMALNERGHDVVVVEQERGTPLAVERLLDCDVAHIHRLRVTEDGDDCVERLRDAGVAVVLDEDDVADTAPGELEQVIEPAILERSRREFRRMLARAPLADVFTTPSEHIAERFEQAGARDVRVIDNYLPGAFNRVEPRGHDGIVIGWHGCEEHHCDVRALGIAEVLEQLLHEHDELRVVTLGLRLDLVHDRYHHEPHIPFDKLTQRLADFDVGIVPLADMPFNRGRSNVKAREYAAAGVPWLASPVGSYEDLGEAEGGQLVEDGEWFEALDRLVRSRRARAKQAKRAKAWAKRETIWNMANVWERVFLDAIAAVRVAA